MPLPHPDEEIADRIAEEVAAEIQTSHPTASPEFRRRLVTLYVAQRLGLTPAPGRISQAALGEHLGLSQQRVSEAEESGLLKLRSRIVQLYLSQP